MVNEDSNRYLEILEDCLLQFAAKFFGEWKHGYFIKIISQPMCPVTLETIHKPDL